MKAVLVIVFAMVVMAIGFAFSKHESGQRPKGQIRVVTENGITCARVELWSGHTCWREKE